MGRAADTASPKKSRLYAGLTDEERKAERRARLLAVGLELFATEGYPAVPIERLCAAAGVSARHFYEHFSSREALLHAVYDDVVSRTLDKVGRALAEAGDDPEQKATAGIEAFVHAFLDDPRNARIVCVEVVGVSREFEKHRHAGVRAFAAVIQTQVEALARKGRLEEGDFELRCIAVAGGVKELMVDYLERSPRPPIARVISAALALFLTLRRPKKSR
jgi:AcrR family transcriptional regulator